MSKEPRELDEMIGALEKHIRLLKDYASRAFDAGELDYGGEIAGKLRLLVTRFGSNRPLLLDLMAKTNIRPMVKLGGPPLQPLPGEPGPGDIITLDQYLALDAIGMKIPSGEFVTLSKTQLIRGWAEQAGSSHEDWKLDPVLKAIFEFGVRFDGMPGAYQELRITTKAVLRVADHFISEYRLRNVDV